MGQWNSVPGIASRCWHAHPRLRHAVEWRSVTSEPGWLPSSSRHGAAFDWQGRPESDIVHVFTRPEKSRAVSVRAWIDVKGGEKKVFTPRPMVKANGRRASFAAALVVSGLVLVACGGDDEAAESTAAPSTTQAPAAQTTPTRAASTAATPMASPAASTMASPVASPMASPMASPEASPVASVGESAQEMSMVPTTAMLPNPPGT